MENEAAKPISFRDGVRGVWRHARAYRGKLFLLALLGLVSAGANGVVPYVTGRFFDALITISEGKTASSTMLPLWASMLIAWAVIQIIANSTDWVMDRSRRKIDTSMHLAIQTEGFIHLLKLPLAYHANEHINAALSKISMAGWRISSIMQSVIQIAPQLLSVAIGIVLAATISVPMAGILVTGVTVYITLLVFMLRPIAAIDHAAHETWNTNWDAAASAVQQASSVKQATAETYEIAKIRTSAEQTSGLWYSLEKIWSNVSFFQRVIVFLTQLAIFIASVGSVSNGSMTIGDLIALNGYALLFFGPFVALGHSWQIVQNGLTAAGQLDRIFEKKEEIYRPAGAATTEEHSGKIIFEQVSFHYGEERDNVLSDITFIANPGEVIALVGESGGGKNTTISLISGYYFPSSGTVSVDGIDTRKWNLSDLRKRIAVVPQEISLFNDTIRNNICYGAFEATDAQIEQAAHEAHIDEYIASLPNGYQTLVGERGIKLSVGQKQRIAIARAILRDPEILILDEPTSALDSETERLVTSALGKLMQNRTTFIIAHRLSTVRKADMILVLKEGRIAESGNHEKLIHIENGIYRHLYELHIGLHE